MSPALRMGPIVAVAAIGAGCAGSNAQAVIGGRTVAARQATGRYCAHCSGGPVWSVGYRLAEPEGEIDLTVRSCTAGETYRFGWEDASATIRLGQDSSTIRCRQGEVRVATCSKDHLRLRFHAAC